MTITGSLERLALQYEEALDEISHLRARNAELLAALERIALQAKGTQHGFTQGERLFTIYCEARDAIAAAEQKGESR